jgi:hypothetical protein
MVRWLRALVIFLILLDVHVLVGHAQTIRAVLIQVPDIREPRVGDAQDDARYVRSLSALTAAIVETNHIVKEHPLDFVILSGNADLLPSDPKHASEVAGRLFAALDVNRIILALDSTATTPSSWRGAFRSQFAIAIPGKELEDIEEGVFSSHEIAFIAVDSRALTSKIPAVSKGELDRIEAALNQAKPTILFAPSVFAPSNATADSLWTLGAPDASRWQKLLKNPHLAGIVVPSDGSSADVHPISRTPADDERMVPKHDVPVYRLPTLGGGEKFDLQPGLAVLAVDVAGHIETRPVFWRNGFSDEARDLQGVLIMAGVSEGDKDYQAAYKQYGEALKSKDADVRSEAEAGLRRTNERLESPWEKWKRGSVVVGAVAERARDIAIGILLGCVVLIVGIARYRRRSEASISVSVKLSEAAPAELFVLCIQREMREIRTIWEAAGSPMKTSHELELDPAADKVENVLDDLPKLIGETPTSVLKLILFFWKYFAWRVESSVYGSEENSAVYVRLCWGWHTEASWILPRGSEPIGIRECASEIAYNLSSYRRIKRLTK